jgi:L-amino acid N-acyltransferase YncA
VSDLQIRDFAPPDTGPFLDLMRRAWGEEAMRPDEFAWWFGRNPAGGVQVAVAEEGGSVLGVLGASAMQMRLDGRELVGSFSVHGTTAEAARGRGIFQQLERHNEERSTAHGVACVLAFASGPTAPLFTQRLGWTRLGKRRLWAKLLRPGAPLRHLRGKGDGAARFHELDEYTKIYGDVRVVPLTRFGPATDEIYERAAVAWGSHVVRTAEHMNWRYIGTPWGYRSYTSIREGHATGWAVVRAKKHRGAPLAVLADLVAPGGYADARALIKRCLADIEHADAMVTLPPPDGPYRRALLSCGFVPAPLTLDFMGKPLQEGFELPSSWHLSLGDTDFF